VHTKAENNDKQNRLHTINIIISHTHQFIIQYNYISGLHVSTVFSHHQALLRTCPMLI